MVRVRSFGSVAMSTLQVAVVFLVFLVFTLATAAPALALPAYGITATNRLAVFDTESPLGTQTHEITGLQPGETILDIDVRVANSRLYGLSSQGRLYIISVTGVATQVGTGTIGLAFNGTIVSMEADPTDDLFIVLTEEGQNFRIDATTGKAIDADPAPGIQGDNDLNPGNPHVVTTAFADDFTEAFNSILYVIDSTTDQLMEVHHQETTGFVSAVGPLGINVANDVSFDIAGRLKIGYLAVPSFLNTTLYRVDLATGAATSLGVLGNGALVLRAMAIEWHEARLFGINVSNELVAFSSHTFDMVYSTQNITGLAPGETVIGIDFRPGTNDLYAIGGTNRLYRLSTLGQATPVGLGTFTVPLEGTAFGVSFDAVSNHLRVVSNSGQNMRINAETGMVIDGNPDLPGVQPDTPVDPAAGVTAIAYTNRSGPPLQHALIGIDSLNDRAVRIGGVNGDPSPNLGTITQSLPLGFDTSSVTGLVWAEEARGGYATAVVGGVSQLYRVGPDNSYTLIGELKVGDEAVHSLTTRSNHNIGFERPNYFVTEAAGPQELRIIRGGSTVGPVNVELVITGSATNGDDYVIDQTIVEFPSGEFEVFLPFTIQQDAAPEAGETIVLTMKLLTPGAFFGMHSSTTITIADDDTPGNAPPVVTIEQPSTEFNVSVAEPRVSLAGTATDDVGVVSVTWRTNWGEAGVATGTTNWQIANVPLSHIDTSIRVTAIDTNGASHEDIVSVKYDQSKYYLSEGATGSFFDEDLLIANPTLTAAPVDILFLKPDGGTVTRQIVLPPTSRTTIAIDEIAGLEAAEVSAMVTSTDKVPLVVERTMRWDGGHYGAHTEKAVQATNKRWYFAEGSQGFFQTYFLLANPSAVATVATFDAFTEGGGVVSRQFNVPKNSRRTVWAGEIQELVNQSFWARITFSNAAIAERAMYFGEPLFSAGHESAGITAPSTSWFHAEGATGGFFTTFLLLANPNDAAAHVTLTYLPASGAPVTVQREIPALGRRTINVSLEDPSLADAAVAARIEADLPIISERSMYWPGAPGAWHEAHNSAGLIDTGTLWGLAEGRVGGPDAHQTYILLANPNDQAAAVLMHFLRANGTTVQREYHVPPLSRFNVHVNSMVPELIDEPFGARIQSDRPIFVERAMYSDAAGIIWAAGTNAPATRLPQ